MLYIWIDSMRRANLPNPPSLTIAKAKNIASRLSIPEYCIQLINLEP
jgi:hypothetical protein